MKVKMPDSVNIWPDATIPKKTVTRIKPANAPSSGRRIKRVNVDACFSRSSPAATAIPASLGVFIGFQIVGGIGELVTDPAGKSRLPAQRMPWALSSTTMGA
jgi:hypothetical protein